MMKMMTSKIKSSGTLIRTKTSRPGSFQTKEAQAKSGPLKPASASPSYRAANKGAKK